MKCKRTSYRSMLAMGTLAAVLSATPAFGKRVVCISVKVDAGGQPTEDGYLASYEGWVRKNPQEGDVIIRGGNLTDCLANVQNGDTLIIIAHGVKICDPSGGELRIEFAWGATRYIGFGNGTNEVALPAGFNTRTNVKVELGMCYSKRDVDAGGPEKSLAVKILDALGGGQGNVVTKAYQNTVRSGARSTYNFPAGVVPCVCGDVCDCPDSVGCSHRYEAYVGALADLWQDYAPWNRPDPPEKTQLTELLSRLASWLEQREPPYLPPLDLRLVYEEPIDEPEPFARTAAADCNEPCAEMTFSWTHPSEAVPALSSWGMVGLALVLLTAGTIVLHSRRREPAT